MILVQALILALGLDHRFFAAEKGLLSVSISEIVACIVLGVMTLEFLRGLRWGMPAEFVPHPPGSLTVRLYLVWVAAAAAIGCFMFANTDGLHSLKDVLPGFVLFGAIRFWMRTEEDLSRVVRGVALTLLILTVLSFSQYLFGGPYPTPIQDNAYAKFALTGEDRIAKPVVGTFASPNSFAVFFAPLFLLCLISHAELGRSRFGWIPLGAMALALLLTQAKLILAVTAITGGCAQVLIALRVRPRGSATAAILVSTLVVMSLAIVVLLVNESSLPAGLTMGTMKGRLGLMAEGVYLLAHFADVTWFGGGIELYRELMPISFHVHNEYLAQALMWGIPGALLFSWVMVRTCWAGRRILWTTKIPTVATALILLVESAGGTQRAGMLFLILGISMYEVRPKPASDFTAVEWS